MRNLRYPVPSKMKVGPHNYRVSIVGDVGHVVHDDSSDLFGHVDHRTGEVTIAGDMSVSQQQDTVLHEALHSVLVYLGRDDEGLVSLLTPPLLDLLQSNHRLVEYLTQRRLVSW